MLTEVSEKTDMGIANTESAVLIADFKIKPLLFMLMSKKTTCGFT